MGEVSSDTGRAIGERLADEMVSQCADLGGTPNEFRIALADAFSVIGTRYSTEWAASREGHL